MSEWIEWKGGKQPVADRVLVDYVMRYETIAPRNPSPAEELRWEHEGDKTDIIAYRIVDSRSDIKDTRSTSISEELEALRTAPRAESLSADFDGLTWTFQIAPDCRVGAGIYALVRVAPDEPRECEK